MTHSIQRKLIWLGIAVSCLLAVVYLVRGFYLLGFASERPVDLALRWRDLQLVAQRQDPYDQLVPIHAAKPPTANMTTTAEIDPGVDTSVGGGYPPWAFFWENLFILPAPWIYARAWFLVVNFACLCLLARYAWNLVPTSDSRGRLFLTAGMLGTNSIGTTLGNGQWGLILVTLLCLAVRWQDRRWGGWSGLLYAITLLKPTVGFTYVAIFLFNRRLLLLVTTGLLTVLAALAAGWWVRTSPLIMVHQMFSLTEMWRHDPYSIQDLLAPLGVSNAARALGALVGSLALALFLVFRRPADSLVQMAICATLARVGPYHQLYDDILIVFLLLALGRLFLSRPNWGNGLAYFIVAISLYLPGRLTHFTVSAVGHIFVWCGALAWLVYRQNESEPLGARSRKTLVPPLGN